MRDNLLEHLGGELFTLIVADDAYLNFLFVTEVLMIVHFTCDKGISTSFHRVVEQEITCTTTDCHPLHRALQQLITSGALHLEGFLHLNHEVIRCHRLRQSADNTTASLDTIHHL